MQTSRTKAPDYGYWTFDRDRLMRLAFAYANAVATRQSEFIFDGVRLYTPYAKYLIDYLENELDKRGK